MSMKRETFLREDEVLRKIQHVRPCQRKLIAAMHSLNLKKWVECHGH